MAVVEAVADVEDVDPIDIEPLNSTLDPDALDALFTPTARRTGESVREVSFEYGGRTVTVRGSGELVIGPSGPTAGI